ncbi:cadherin-related family member 5-like isoform X2 [Columba livia]|uniref:cadherin-related family member 5-like isoform X2 n=1 Tax=Columba livia TaxID=8932 RepID=UPI0031BB5EC5
MTLQAAQAAGRTVVQAGQAAQADGGAGTVVQAAGTLQAAQAGQAAGRAAIQAAQAGGRWWCEHCRQHQQHRQEVVQAAGGARQDRQRRQQAGQQYRQHRQHRQQAGQWYRQHRQEVVQAAQALQAGQAAGRRWYRQHRQQVVQAGGGAGGAGSAGSGPARPVHPPPLIRPPRPARPGQQRRGRRRPQLQAATEGPVPVPMASPSCPALLAACLVLQLARVSRGDGCSSFGNLFTAIAENSAHGSLVARLPGGDTGDTRLQLCLAGADATWFYLDGRSVRLNVSNGRALDREELESPVLMVALTCAEDGFSPVEYRLIVQVLNENDNQPHFQGATVLTHNVSELAAVHSVVFSAQAEDADGDTLMYVIDTASPDARFFRIDLPNSGKVLLARALDFETRQHLEVVLTAVEMNTRERFNASARVRVNVLDGDDQYPQFLPCTPRSHLGVTICTSPVYTANVTEGQLQGGPLNFSPSSVYAEDGDRGLRAPITYSLLAGRESSRFHIDNVTGAITLLRAVESSRNTPAISLSVMAAQVNDASKFAVTQALVRVLAPNRHPPRFPRASYRAFVPAGTREAALLLTFGGRVLALRAHDPDFPGGVNPQVRYSLCPGSSPGPPGPPQPQLFQVMPNGLLVAQSHRLHPAQRYRLQVLARDEESGETSNTTVELEVLWPGQAAPRDPSEAAPGPPLGAGALAGALGALGLLGGAVLFLTLRALRRRQRRQESAHRAALAAEKHPNSLRWFQPVPTGKSSPTPPSLYYPNEGYSEAGGGEGPPPALPPPPPPAPQPSPSPPPKPQANSVGRPGGGSPGGGSPKDSPPPPQAPSPPQPPSPPGEVLGGYGELGGGSPLAGGGRRGGPPGGLPALEEESEDSGEEGPGGDPAGGNAHPALGGDPRVPPTLLQLLEDSIEC